MMKLEWIAYYSDGRELRETQIKYDDLDRTLLKQFSLANEKSVVATVKLGDGDSLFYRRRTFAVGTPKQYSIYLMGCRRKNSQPRIYIVKSDGTVSEDTEFRNEWYEPQWLPQEQSSSYSLSHSP